MNRLLRIFIALQFTIFSLWGFAQQSDSFESNFNNGKELLKLEKYGLAMQAFKPLTSEIDGNPYQKIASFYYAVAASKNGQQALARDMFLQIANKYANWEKIDEVYQNIYL